MIHEKRLDISFNELSAWQDFIDNDKGEHRLKCVKKFTVNFSDTVDGKNITIDISICENMGNKPCVHTDFRVDGKQILFLNSRDTIAGEYKFDSPYLKDTYIVIIPDTIEASLEGRKKYRKIEEWLQKLDEKALGVLDNITKANYQDFPIVDKTAAIEDILHRCENDDTVLESMFERSERSGLANPRNNLVSTNVYVDKRSDRECPNCHAAVEEEHLLKPNLVHERTEMRLKGYCSQCGCDYMFIYSLFMSDISYR